MLRAYSCSLSARRFFGLIGSYILFGFLYQRIVNEAKGREQIPNFSFWKKLGNLSAVRRQNYLISDVEIFLIHIGWL